MPVSVHYQGDSLVTDGGGSRRALLLRVLIFVGVFVAVAGGGLVYDYSRPAIYRATSRLSVEPPAAPDDAARAQFALNEAQAMRRSELTQAVAAKLRTDFPSTRLDAGQLESAFSIDHVPQTTVIELRGEGHDRAELVIALKAWVDAYISSRKKSDRADETDALEQAKHDAQIAQKAVEAKQRELEAFRQRHGIVSTEREENPGTARLKGLHEALNEASAREVKAEARVKAVQEGLNQGRGIIRESDKWGINDLETRALDLREKMRDLEHDYTQQYLSMDPKYKALKANLTRAEQQIEQEKERSRKAALNEAQEELAGAQRAAQRLRQQSEALKQDTQVFSARFAEHKQRSEELLLLQETRRAAFERQAQLESLRKPTEVRVRVLSVPAAGDAPIAPDYSRDAAIALAAGLIFALIAVWLHDYLRDAPGRQGVPGAPPIIQIAYPAIESPSGSGTTRLTGAPTALLGPAPGHGMLRELTQVDVSALWRAAPPDERLVIAAMFTGISPSELSQLRWKHVDFERGLVHVPGASARMVLVLDPLRMALKDRIDANQTGQAPETPLCADADGTALDESLIDGQLQCVAHDAGLRHPEEVTARSLHFTYAAYLVRQGIRMVDLVSVIGRVGSALSAELMRFAPPNSGASADQIERVYPSLAVPRSPIET